MKDMKPKSAETEAAINIFKEATDYISAKFPEDERSPDSFTYSQSRATFSVASKGIMIVEVTV